MALTRRTTLLLVSTAFAGSAARAQPVKIRLGTATPGGGFPVYGDAFIAAVTAQDPALEIVPVNTKGSTENVPRLEAGTLDLALVQGEVVHEALDGLAQYDGRLVQGVEMRYFAGMTEAEIAEALGVTDRTVRRDWEKARLWLADALK